MGQHHPPWCPQALDSKPPFQPPTLTRRLSPRRAIGSNTLPVPSGTWRAHFSSLQHVPTLCHSSSPSSEAQVNPRKPAFVPVWSLTRLSPMLSGHMQTMHSQSWKRPSERLSPNSPFYRGAGWGPEPALAHHSSTAHSWSVAESRLPRTPDTGPHSPSENTEHTASQQGHVLWGRLFLLLRQGLVVPRAHQASL